MDSQSFNSDSTYCSLYENSSNTNISNNKRCISNDSDFLEEVHNKILLHWEGQRLIGRLEAHSYMKRIEKMKFETYKDQYFAHKIQSSLLKIFKLIKKFEANKGQNYVPKSLTDPINDCSLTEDLKLGKNNDFDPKHILVGTTTTSVNNDKSFPLDMLTNTNFEILASNLNRSIDPINTIEKNQIPNGTMGYGMESKPQQVQNKNSHSMELFPSESEKTYREHNSKHSKKSKALQSYLCSSSDSDEAAPSKRFCTYKDNISNKENNVNNIENTFDQSLANNMEFEKIRDNSNELGSRNSSSKCVTSSKNIEEIIDTLPERDENYRKLTNNAYDSISQQIVPSNFDQNDNDVVKADKCDNVSSQALKNTEISATHVTDEAQSLKLRYPDTLKPIKLNQLVTLEKTFKESYNKKINNLICYAENQSEQGNCWQEIQKDFEQNATMIKEVNHKLRGLFEKLNFEEREAADKKFLEKQVYKEGNFHKFSLEDEKKLDIKNLFEKNISRLEEISAEFKEKLRSEIPKDNDEDNNDIIAQDLDFEGWDWRKLLEK